MALFDLQGSRIAVFGAAEPEVRTRTRRDVDRQTGTGVSGSVM